MATKIGINGFGRIGRLVFRAAAADPDVTVMGINDPFIDLEYMAYLLRYDTVHGRFDGEIKVENGKLVVNGEAISVYNCMDPKEIPGVNAAQNTLLNPPVSSPPPNSQASIS